ncbi:hypothetical protein [Candidatus Electrothrix sp.]|uniref:hypothetical protein n=1 Tax=Candidatus Electrothrix sp. TaxID=2170559 RepID=UPI0040579BB3
MNPDDFVEIIRGKILDENSKIYADLFDKTKIDEVTDNNWKVALEVYNGLDDRSKSLFLSFVRQVMTDTLSNLFAILDGSAWLEQQEDDFVLSHTGTKLNGDLQNIFLEKEE